MIEAINPNDGKRIATYDEMSPDAVKRAIEVANERFLSWRGTNFAHRAERMRKAGAILRANAKDYGRLMAEEMGKPVKDGAALRGGDQAIAVGSQQSGASQGQHGHHHQHVDGAGGSGGQNLLSLLAGGSGSASSQSTPNPNGTTTTSITYADGSTVSMTTAAASGASGSDTTSASAGAPTCG